MLTLLMLVILFACVATLYTEGMWSNAIRLINVVTAALLAVNFWEPVAASLDGWQPTYTYVWDFLVLWGLFAIFMAVFRAATDLLSRVKVRFLKIADRIGSGLLSVWIGWVMVCFTMLTLHTAPLARNFLGGSLVPEERMVMGLAPDRQWLGFVQKVSLGAFCRTASKKDIQQDPAWAQDKTRTFDPRGEFLPKYATRRANLEAHVQQTDTIRVRR